MKKLWWGLLLLPLFFLPFFHHQTINNDKVVNVYIWGGDVPDSVIAQFQKETGIRVNYSTYDSNETLYAKLKATKNSGYDVIEPSSYYLGRMAREDMLEKIDSSRLSNYSNLDPEFMNQAYDPKDEYSIPFLWGTVGLFINTQVFKPGSLTSWDQLWAPQYKNKIVFIDDSRTVFASVLIAMGYPANDENPEHIKAAYLKLKALMPNIRLFNTDAMPSLVADSDATVGMIWNGDLYNGKLDNPNLEYIYPKEGFAIWVDTFAIAKNAPHLDNAYKFLNFMLRPDIAVQTTLQTNYPTTNIKAPALLPPNIANSPIIYPSKEIMARGQFQTDVNDQALALYNHYWELLKVGA